MLIVADDTPRNERELKAGEMACPECKGELRPWGHTRPRRLRMLSGSRVIRPRRSCCKACVRGHEVDTKVAGDVLDPFGQARCVMDVKPV